MNTNPFRMRALVIIWAVVILILSMAPGESIPKLGWKMIFQVDKLAHFGVYFILSALATWSEGGHKTRIVLRDLVVIASVCSLYGLILEAMQYFFLSDRYFEIPDLIANIIGSIAGTVVVFLLLKKE